MTDLIEEFTNHVQEGLGMLMNEFPHERGTDTEEILLGRDARRKLREWQKKFSNILEAVDRQEQVLRIMPYEAPGKNHGAPAYDMDGTQLLVSVVDNLTEEHFNRIYSRTLNWTFNKPHLAAHRAKSVLFFSALRAIRNGTAEKPEPEQ